MRLFIARRIHFPAIEYDCLLFTVELNTTATTTNNNNKFILYSASIHIGVPELTYTCKQSKTHIRYNISTVNE